MTSRQLQQLAAVARRMLQGSLTETTRTCGRPGCRCQRGERHGPHTYLTFKRHDGVTSALYVPRGNVAWARGGVEAWARFWRLAVEIAAANRKRESARWKAESRARRSHAAT